MKSDELTIRIVLLVPVLFGGVESHCRLEECSEWFLHTKQYETLVPGNSERYCQVLSAYLKCLNDTTRTCRGILQFYTNVYSMKKQWQQYQCGLFKPREEANNRCHFLSTSSHRSIRFCSLYGDPHLRKFDGTFETCTEEGARPLVDNRYFLIQVTNAKVRDELATAVNKITVLIRRHNCTRFLHYEASSDQANLPISFVDGISHTIVDGKQRTVEILHQETNYIEIVLRHIDTSIHIRRQGPYLSISIRVPEYVIQTSTTYASTLCWSGCRSGTSLDVNLALSNPQQFAKCYIRKIHVPVKLAIDRCKTVNVTDAFFDSCVFDLMLTGNEYLVAMAKDVQSDFRRHFPLHYHYEEGRTDLSIYLKEPPYKFDNCISLSSTVITLLSVAIPSFIIIVHR